MSEQRAVFRGAKFMKHVFKGKMHVSEGWHERCLIECQLFLH